MDEKRKQTLSKISYALNGTLFLASGILLLDEGKSLFGLMQVAAALLNLGMLPQFKYQIKQKFSSAIHVMNVTVALATAVDYIQSGKSYLQYLWILAALLSAIAFVKEVRKRNAEKQKHD